MLKNQYIGETWKHLILIIGALIVGLFIAINLKGVLKMTKGFE